MGLSCGESAQRLIGDIVVIRSYARCHHPTRPISVPLPAVRRSAEVTDIYDPTGERLGAALLDASQILEKTSLGLTGCNLQSLVSGYPGSTYAAEYERYE